MNKYKLSLAGNLILSLIVLFFAARHIYFQLTYKPVNEFQLVSEQANTRRTDVFNHLPVDSNDIVFVGTSLTAEFPLEDIFPGRHCVNRGIGGNTMQQIEERIGTIFKRHPKAVLLEGGTNDVLQHVDFSEVLTSYQHVISQRDSMSPRTILCFQSIPYLGKQYDSLNISVLELNTYIKIISDGHEVTFIDLTAKLSKECLSTDDIHLNSRGYIEWRNLIMPFINSRRLCQE